MEYEAEIHGVGVSWCDFGTATPVVFLISHGNYVSINISPDQAHSIQSELKDERSERPLSHDLLLNIVTELGGAVDKVTIDDISGGTFYAQIHIQRYVDGQPQAYSFDARPSDGIALAVRSNCPIFISEMVMDSASQPIEDSTLYETGSTEWE